jgi:hypothetical protein
MELLQGVVQRWFSVLAMFEFRVLLQWKVGNKFLREENRPYIINIKISVV